MNERNQYSGEQSMHPDLDIILSRQAEWLSLTLSPNETEALRFKRGLRLERVSDPDLYCVYPARIEENRAGDSFRLLYDIPTMQNLIDSFAQSYQLT